MELVDGLKIGRGEFWKSLAFKSVISNLEGPRAIVIDEDLLRAVASVYCRGASKEATLTISDAGKPGKVSIEISGLHETASGRTESEDQWRRYVVTDLLGGSLTQNRLELPVFLSAGDV